MSVQHLLLQPLPVSEYIVGGTRAQCQAGGQCVGYVRHPCPGMLSQGQGSQMERGKYHMIRQILVGIDGSEYSDSALQYGCYLAKAFQATVHGVHVVDIVQVESPVLYDLAGAIGAAPQFNL